MVSKKNKGADPEALRAIEAEARGQGSGNTLGGSAGMPTLRNDEMAYLAGRRSMAYELLQSGGLDSGKLGTEILFLLPDQFVEFYASVFHQALRVGDSSVMHGRSGGVDKAKGRTGMATEHDEKGRSRGMGAQAGGSGKKYKNTPMAVGSERALKAKEKLDQGLVELVQDTRRMLAKSRAREALGGSGELPGQRQCTGFRRTWIQNDDGLNKDGLEGPPKCRQFLKETWRYCPSCGTRVKSSTEQSAEDQSRKVSD